MIDIARKNKSYRPKEYEEPVYQHQSLRKDMNRERIAEYAKSASNLNASFGGTANRLSAIDINTTRTLFDDIQGNAGTIATQMKNLYHKNGTVKGVINHFSNLLTLNYTIAPSPDAKNNFQMPTGIEEYLTAAQAIDRYKIKQWGPYFIKQTLLQGASFFYEISNATGVVYMEFPHDICRISTVEDGVYRWKIDIEQLSRGNQDLSYLPNEFLNAIETGPQEENNKWDGNYYLVGNKGFALTFDQSAMMNDGVAIPEFASLLLESLEVEKAKVNVQLRDDIDAVRLIHAEVPTDKEGNILMTHEEAQMWTNQLRRGLPTGVAAPVTPMTLTSIPLGDSGSSKAYETVNDAQKQLYKSGGTSGAFYGEDTASSNIVKMSLDKDAAYAYSRILPALEAYYNYVLGAVKTESGAKWTVNILEQNVYTKDATSKELRDSISITGGSRSNYQASIGMTPLRIYTLLHMEQNLLDIDNLMVPKQTSFTMTSADAGGRPTEENPTDDTERINDNA